MPWLFRVPEDVVRAADAIQEPSSGFQLSNQVRTLHCAYHTHFKDQRSSDPV
jgi:hypothetical protein